MEGETTLLVDSRYIEHARSQAVQCSVLLTPGSAEAGLKTILRRYQGKRIGIESKHLSHYTVLQLQSQQKRLSEPTLIPTVDLIEELRILKETAEIEAIQQAFQIAQIAYQSFKETISAGLTELQAAAKLEFELRRAGGEGISFETIIASGPRSSLPHGTATQKPLRKSEMVLIDFGVRYRGYTSDLTRIHLLAGAKKPEFYDVVREAQQKALQIIKPGVACCDVDKAARRFITDQGYGDSFGHSTGHGLGLEVHESPLISAKSRREIQEGMVFTIEPGIYLPGQCGVRIEDAIVVTRNGYRLLSGPDI